MNISIISDCNNNCEYCFQKDYHKMHKMMSYEEFEDVLRWGLSEESIGILGGEPTLHPDIVKIMTRMNEVSKDPRLMTNLLCETSVLEELIKIPNIKFLVNTTYREEFRDLFYQNIELLYSKKVFLKNNNIGIAFGITLINEEATDNEHIENLLNLIDSYPDFIFTVRMGLATPYHDKPFILTDYQKPVKYLIEKITYEHEDLTLGFDCSTNNCQINPFLMAEILDNPKVHGFRFGCCDPVLEVLVDKSLIYCFSCPDDFMKVDNYRRFQNANQARNWYIARMSEYLRNNAFQCRGYKEDCRNGICGGCCPAINEHLIRQRRKSININN